MASWAKPGVKCVCVDARPVLCDGVFVSLLQEGRAYTITSVQTETLRAFDGGVAEPSVTVRLAGVARPRGKTFGYHIRRFRPLITKTQDEDVAMFKSIIENAPRELT